MHHKKYYYYYYYYCLYHYDSLLTDTCICLVFTGQMKKIKGCPFRDLKARIAQALPFGTLSALLIFSSDLFVHPSKTISLHFFFLFVWITVNMSFSPRLNL